MHREAVDAHEHEPRTFTVRGCGVFPIDMLRYDAAWPASERDASLILRLVQHEEGEGEVVLKTRSHAAPNRERWRSFGWDVFTS